MRYDEFKEWLDNGGGGYCKANSKSIGTYIRNIKRIEERIGVNLDDELARGRFDVLYESLEPTANNDTPNQKAMGWGKYTERGTIAGYRASMNHYRRFCEVHRPV